MRNNIFSVLATAVVLLVVVIACKRNFNNEFDARGTNAGSGPFKGTVTLPRVIATSRTLSKDTLYILDGRTYVDSGAVLTIQAGGRVEAKKKLSNDSASMLIITRTAKLYAEGTSTNPIHFTSHETSPQRGDWGGIAILGCGPLNKEDSIIQGFNPSTVPPGIDVEYGGSGRGLGDSMDCSGKLTYCLIEYAGIVSATDNVFNGLTCAGVGAGTVLDFIEVYMGGHDAFQFFGGTVNAKHLFACAPYDDAFDFDCGYTGKIQFALSVLRPSETYSANPNGIESDNNATGANDAPRTKAVISNMTVIGLADSTYAAVKGLWNGAFYRKRSSYILRNSIVMGYPVGVWLESDSTQADSNFIQNNIVHSFLYNLDTMSFPTRLWTLAPTNKRYRNLSAYTDIRLHDPFHSTAPDFRPDSTSPTVKSPALSWTPDFSSLPSTPSGGMCSAPLWRFIPTTYIGAFGKYNPASPGINNWLFGWARY